MNKKGQAAMEFLMTYGWAILVVLVAIGALAYFGVLSPEKLLPEKCLIPTGSGLFCDKNLVSANVATATVPANVKIRIKNSLADTVTVTAIAISPTCGTETPYTNRTIAPDVSEDFTVTCTGLVAGKLKGDMTIKYSVEGFAKATTGSLITTAA